MSEVWGDSGIYPYATLSPDQTSMFDLHWLNESSFEDDGIDDHTVEYREKGDTEWTETSISEGGLMTSSDSDQYYYWARIENLNSGTVYEARIVEDDKTENVEFETFPRRLHKRTLFGISLEDPHIRRDGVECAWVDDKSRMDLISDEEPEFMLLDGDFLTSADAEDSSSADDYVDWTKNWLSRLDNNEKLVPVFYICGNHEVGNGDWQGTKEESLEDNKQFQDFTRNESRFDPAGEYYGQISIADYVNFVALDTHSAYPEDQGDWLDKNLDGQKRNGVIFQHNPMLVSGQRRDVDFDLGELCVENWMPAIEEAGNIQYGISGNIHVRKHSQKLTITDSGSDDSIQLKDGRYLVEANGDEDFIFREFGEGWTCDKDTVDRWYIDESSSGDSHYHRIYLRKDEHEMEEVIVESGGNTVNNFKFEPKKINIDRNNGLSIGAI